MKSEKIAAIVVTFNRLELLKKVIASINKQTRPVSRIIVVNNSSTDGTKEWLETQEGITIVTQENIGSSGGQYTGFKRAHEDGYEWLWVMDDDVTPRPDCLENLMKYSDKNIIAIPLRYEKENMPVLLEIKELNMTNPFRSIWKKIININDFENNVAEIEGMAFEGPLFHRSVVDNIGLPEKKFFIYGDDTEYSIRALKENMKLLFVKDANFDRMLDYEPPATRFSWKTYYVIRNIIAIDILHGNPIIRFIRPFGYLISWLLKSRSFNDLKITLKAFFDGYFYQSENK